MAIVPESELVLDVPVALSPSPLEREEATPEPGGLGDLFGAAFRQNNAVVSGYEFLRSEVDIAGMADDPDYDPFAPGELDGYDDQAFLFSDSRSAAETARIKARIDREREDRATLDRAGAGGVLASIAAGVLDPVNLVPVGGVALKGGKLAGVGGRALEAATAGLGSAALSESILFATQVERTPQEAGLNALSGAVLGGLLGTLGGLVTRNGEVKPVTPKFRDAIAAEWVDAGGLSAQSARAMTGDQMRLAPALGLEKLEAANPITGSPLLRALHSPSAYVANLMSELAETPLFLRGNADDVASPIAVETRIKAWSGPLARALEDMDDHFVRYRIGRAKTFTDMPRIGLGDLAGQTGGKMTAKAFREEVGKAMRRGDTHAIPEVAAAAKALRRDIFDPLKEAAIRAGLLPEGVQVETAASYLTRVYNLEKIASQRNAFTDRLTDWLELEQIRTPVGERLTRAELRGEAERVVSTLLSGSPGRTAYDLMPNLRGPLKDRTLNVPDEVIEPWLESDVERIARIYARTMSTDVELAKAFGRPDMGDQIEAIKASYDEMFRRTPDGPENAALQKRLKRDLEDIAGVRDRIRGLYGAPADPMGPGVRLLRAARGLNFVRLLGGMTISAIPDLARTVLAAGGLGRLMTRGLVPMIADLRRFKLAAAETKIAGTALDMVLNTRAMQMADVFEDFARYSAAERGLQYAGEKFSIYTGMAPWNAAMKQFVGVLAQTRMLEAMAAGAKAKKGELRRLRMLGVDADMARRIVAQFDAHGERGGAWWANTQAWDDQAAATAYRAALVKEVDRIIVTPGQDKPLWISSELGKTIGQFKSYVLSATTRVLIAGLQERDAAVAQSFVTSIGLGMLVYYLKTAGNPDKEISDNPMRWVVEGLDRSGALGWAFEADNLVAKGSGGRLGAGAAIGEPSLSRFSSRGLVDTVLGPTAGLFTDAAQTLAAVAMATVPDAEGAVKPMTRADVHRIRRLLPFQNLPYLAWLFDRAEGAAGDAIGAPETQPR